MRNQRRTTSAIAAVVLALALSSTAPALASTPDSAKSSVPPVSRDDAPSLALDEDSMSVPPISPPLLDKLHELGLEGEVTSVQGGEGAGVFYGGEEGTWVINLDPDATADTTKLQTGKAVAAQFSYGGCAGYFIHPHKVGGYLEWGGSDNCVASNNQYYLHRVTVALYDTCVGPLCVALGYIKTINSSAAQNFNNVAVVNGYDYCVGQQASNGRTYEQKVTVTVRSVQYGPFWDRGNVVKNCDISP